MCTSAANIERYDTLFYADQSDIPAMHLDVWPDLRKDCFNFGEGLGGGHKQSLPEPRTKQQSNFRQH